MAPPLRLLAWGPCRRKSHGGSSCSQRTWAAEALWARKKRPPAASTQQIRLCRWMEETSAAWHGQWRGSAVAGGNAAGQAMQRTEQVWEVLSES